MSTPRQTLTVKLTHAEIRIAELTQALAAERFDNQRLGTQLAITRDALDHVKRVAPRAIKTIAHTPWVRPAHMEAARDLAMRTHAVVHV